VKDSAAVAADAPRVLLLQVRSHPAAEAQERLCFLDRLEIPEENLASRNLVPEPALAWRDVAGADAVIIGGAGSHSVTREYPFTGPLAEVVRRLVAEGRPLFGSCWGHQFIAWALGGRVEHAPERGEVGTFPVELTAAGASDPLFAGFPPCFAAQFGHHDTVVELPAGVEELAFTGLCRNQALRIPGRPVYGTQFHSEMNVGHMRERLMMYRDAYLPVADAEAEIDRILAPSPHADTILGRFLALLG
jgi:GMP synthase (glutamine-hydrolysing)